MEENIQNILSQECFKYAKYYGCNEIRHSIGSPFYTCVINSKKTALYPIFRKGNKIWTYDYERLERNISEYSSSHKIIRIEVSIDKSNKVEDVQYVIMYDKILQKST